jgi:hypothetical protein
MGDGSGFGSWVGAVLDLPAELIETSDAFWSGALGWSVAEPGREHPEFHFLRPAEGDAHVLVQTIDGSPRVHLDLYADDVPGEAERMVGLGAELVAERAHWNVLSSPGGFPFCLVAFDGERSRPPAATWPDGHRSRLVQLCLDVPHGRVDRETTFWRGVTGWQFRPSRGREFAGHLYPGAGGSLQLLIQELGEDDAGTSTRAHLDLGADDREAEAARLVELGAQRLATGRGWIVMRDPAGLTFCVTGQPP